MNGEQNDTQNGRANYDPMSALQVIEDASPPAVPDVPSHPSNFEQLYIEANGKRPTADEAKKYLAFERMAKSSSLDPLTMVLIASASRDAEIAADRKALNAAIAEDRSALQTALVTLARIEKKMARTAEPPLLPAKIVLAVSAALMALVALVACLAPWPWYAIVAALALGAIGGLGQPWIGPVLADWRWKLGLG